MIEFQQQSSPRLSPLSKPAVKEFLDGLAEIIVQAILDEEEGLLTGSTSTQDDQPC